MPCLIKTIWAHPHGVITVTPKEQKIAKSIGRAVSSKRKAKGFTQGFVAETIGVEPETISRIERGVTLAPISRLADIADVLKCPLSDLLRDGSPRTTDRALSVSAQLQTLSEADTRFVMEIIDKLSTRLRRKG
jgi:transcriptional regulator with XRE-family HTH domain